MIFQNRRSALQGRTNRSCCECQRSYYQMKRADNPHLMANGLSALRLCVTFFSYSYEINDATGAILKHETELDD